MKLTDWHKRIVLKVPHAELVTSPGQLNPSEQHYSTFDFWLGYGRYTVTAIASDISGEVERVECDVVPRDMRKSGEEYKARVYEAAAGSEDTIQRMLFAIVAYEAEQHT